MKVQQVHNTSNIAMNGNIINKNDALHLKPRKEYNKQYKIADDLIEMSKR